MLDIMDASEQRPRIAFFGLGKMGEPMARNLLRAGFETSVWNRSRPAAERLREAGAQLLGDPAEAADADVVIAMLPDLPQIEELLAPLIVRWGGAPVARPRTLVVMSTVSPAAVVRFGARLEGLAELIDAPVSGGTEGAEQGTLAIMAGGSEAAFQRVKQVFDAMGRAQRLGGLGAGSLAKACNQVLVGLTAAALAEAVVVAERSGLDGQQLLEVLSGGLADSAVLRQIGPRIAARDFRVRGAAQFMLKDLGFFLDAAEQSGTDAALSRAARDRYAALVEQGLGGQDLAVVRTVVEGRE
ncbi:NAD(P)-dependent oxidoreductase [Arthrobacter russicus]|uniref:2-hydroxy-3-oxopropionate reductase n=1 Tax=Arthrobacter russicus TaxID=172040 RepID=A0ABU1JCB4_9MICC|nr:NAD(P)-dependent oxidoreductase [Arthrobacter russicus]MDN5667826.1 NAD(P)-dependent oxidoreductase [Renibacterium salmoninarum]MDR6270054.1 2-hydroxy-3-oxopropionate reductase [Arthrobacter russicus]